MTPSIFILSVTNALIATCNTYGHIMVPKKLIANLIARHLGQEIVHESVYVYSINCIRPLNMIVFYLHVCVYDVEPPLYVVDHHVAVVGRVVHPGVLEAGLPEN
jgi:hypothetical protein